MTLCDLPEYPFDHSKRYLHESRISKNLRLRSQPKLDLLGKTVPDWNPLEPRWRHFLKTSELPWVEHHKINGTVIFPAAGMIVMALEAVKQLVSPMKHPVAGWYLRDVRFQTALIVPEDARGVEVQLSIRQTADLNRKDVRWCPFRLCANINGNWLEICNGSIRIDHGVTYSELYGDEKETDMQDYIYQSYAQKVMQCNQVVNVDNLYQALQRSGLDFGPHFQSIASANYAESLAAAEIKTFRWPEMSVVNTRQPHIVHPCTLDGLLQLPIVAFTKGGSRPSQTLVPFSIRSMWISNSGTSWPGTDSLAVLSELEGADNLGAEARTTAVAKNDRKVCVRLDGVRYAFVHGSAHESGPERQAFWHLAWQTDPDLLSGEEIQECCQITASGPEPILFFEKLTFLMFAFLIRMQRELEMQGTPTFTLPKHFQRYLTWAQGQIRRYKKNQMPGSRLSWEYLAFDETFFASTCRDVESANAQGRIYVATGRNLTQILCSEVDTLELLFQSDLMTDLYQEQTDMPNTFRRLELYLSMLFHKYPQGRYLEIGGGTAGCTTTILRALHQVENNVAGPPRYSTYTFTDISASFFEKAKSKVEGYQGLSFKRLDIEKPPTEQGFEAASFDVVIAANVLHATQNLDTTLGHVRQLLRPGGKLILYEITNPDTLRNNFTIGLLRGWWQSADDYRVEGPCIDVGQWNQALRRSGFSGVDFSFRDYENDVCHELSVLASTKLGATEDGIGDPLITIVSQQSSPRQMELVARLQECLSARTMHPIQVVSLKECSQRKCQPDSVYVFTDEMFKSCLQSLDEHEFGQLQRCLACCNVVIWLSQATNHGLSPPEFGLIQGLARVLRVETSLKFVTIALEPNPATCSFHARIISQIIHSTIMSPVNRYEPAYEEQDGSLRIPRMHSAKDLGEEIHARCLKQTSQILPWESCPPLRLAIESPGMLDTLHFTQDADRWRSLGPDEVEVEVRAVGLNFKDCLIALGSVAGDSFGNECAGVVSRCGSDTPFRVGDRVSMSTVEAFKTYARSKMQCVHKLYSDISFAEAAAIHTQFVTAWMCIHEIGRLGKGESVLIHAGAGGTGQAAIQLSQLLGANVFATVGSLEKKALLINEYGLERDHIFYSRDLTFVRELRRMTGGRGVDVIVNSLAGESLFASWECLAPYGRFVEIGKRDILANASLPMYKFSDGVSFSSFDGSKWMLDRPDVAQRGIQTVFDLHSRRLLHEARPLQVYSISDVSKAFRELADGKTMGKTVLETKPEAKVSTILDRQHTFSFDTNKTYVIAGGLGGIGRAIATRLVERGARWLLLLSRSGCSSTEAKSFVKKLQDSGAHVVTPICDIADKSAVKETLECASQDMPPIKGCIQASMVLRDAVFAELSFEQWRTALKPKVDGTRNLHVLLPRDLDFFIMLSSVSAICGQHGQANYAAANTYLDAFAHYRVAHGEKAVSINLGAVVSDGYLAENATVKDRLLSQGSMLPISREHLYGMLDYYCDPARGILTPLTCQVVVGINTPANILAAGKDQPSWMQQPLFSSMSSTFNSGNAPLVVQEEMQQVRRKFAEATSLSEAGAIVVEALIGKLRRNLTTVPDTVNVHTPIHSYGVDSLLAVELRSWLSKYFGADVPIFDILGGTNLASLGIDVATKTWRLRK